MAQVMQAKVRQSGISPQPCPHLVYRGQRLAAMTYERMVIFTARAQVFKDGDRLVIEWNASYLPRLAVRRGDRPVPMLKIKVFPAGTQGFIDPATG